MTLLRLTDPRQGGRCLFVVAGAAPYAGVAWRLAQGAGVLTPTAGHADAAGLASAYYDATGDQVGDTIRVEADVYA